MGEGAAFIDEKFAMIILQERGHLVPTSSVQATIGA
jgi:hypothetical protein